MIDERYSIQFSDDYILFHGNMTIEEGFDFINFYEKKGFNEISMGHENSCLCLMKKDKESEEKTKFQKECDESISFYKTLYEGQVERNNQLKKKIIELESLIKTLLPTGVEYTILGDTGDTQNEHC